MLGGALEARRGRGERTAKAARRLSLGQVAGTAPGPSHSIHKYRFEPTDMPRGESPRSEIQRSNLVWRRQSKRG